MLSTKELILKVQQRPALWDRNSLEYQKKSEKEEAWKEICIEAIPSFCELKKCVREQIMAQFTKKWYNVRDAYVKFLKGNRRKGSKPYIHSDTISFLDPVYLRGQKKHDNIDQVEPEEYEEESNLETETEVFLDIDEDVTPSKLIKISESGSESTSYTANDMTAIFSNLIEKEEDEDRAFFNSITPTVKQLSSDAKLEFRIQVLTLLRNLKTPVIKIEKDPIDSND